ncbi:hypothetical protein APA_4688 [Pseudanabaena sp. lw0831]|nr:hypothetical protein APA_4688 [Pseudanabaena sp. lw0831]
MDVPVSPAWEACSLAAHPFEPSWQPTNDYSSLLHKSFPDSIPLTQEQSLELQEINMRSLSFT